MKAIVIAIVCMFIALPAFAQSGTAVEVYPGITHYNGPGGSTMGVEVLPGVRYFSGAVNGSAIEVYPGITHYNLQPGFNAEVDARISEIQREGDRRLADHQREQAARHAREDKLFDFMKR